MLEITNYRDGAVLDHNHGIETDEYLEIIVEGLAAPQADVRVNGTPARRRDRNFSCPVRLTGKVNTITVESSDYFGVKTQTITVLWDKKSFKRYNFFIDDCSFFLRSIALSKPASIFEEMFLGRLKKIHDKFGTKFTLNLFFHDDHHDFSISDFPADYKQEFQANASWLRLSFHAYSEFPDRPYQHADQVKLAADYDLIYREVCRFAGAESFIAPMVVHWGMTNPDNFAVLKERGTRCLAGGFLGSIAYIGEKHSTQVTDIGYHYEKDVAHYIRSSHRFYDRFHDIVLIDNLLCCNYDSQEVIAQKYAALADDPRDTLNLMTHEQYCYSDYFNYIPDHLDRIEKACELAAANGYSPVWFNDGLMGNMAWE